MKRILAASIAAFALAATLGATLSVALAAEPATVESVATPPAVVPDVGADPLAFLGLVSAAVQGRQWALLGALVLIGLVWLVRRFARTVAAWKPWTVLGRASAWLTTDRGGVLLVLLGGCAQAVALVLLGGGPLSWSVLLDALVAAVTAAGGYAALKKLFAPTGEDRADQIQAVAAAVQSSGTSSTSAAADALSKSLGR